MMIAAILFAVLLGAFVFIMLPRGAAWQRAASAVMFLVLIALVYGGSVEMLSRPKPLRLEWRDASKARVLGASLNEGKAIYVWLQIGDSPEPRAYVLPWNTRMAQQLQNAMQSSQSTGSPVEISRPFARESDSDPGKPKFYALPQPPLPPKAPPNNSASLYRAP